MSEIKIAAGQQDMIAAYFEYKIDIKKDSEEFQTLGWVNEEWWFSRMGHMKIPREYCFGAAIVVCRRGFFEMYAASECPHCKQISRWPENVTDPTHLNGLLQMPCSECGYAVSRSANEINWHFKLAKHLIKDEKVYFSEKDDLAELKAAPLMQRVMDMMFPWRKKK